MRPGRQGGGQPLAHLLARAGARQDVELRELRGVLLGLEPQRRYARGASVCGRGGRVGQRARRHRAFHGRRGLSQERGRGRRAGQGGHGGKEPAGRANSAVTVSGAERGAGGGGGQRFPPPLTAGAEGHTRVQTRAAARSPESRGSGGPRAGEQVGARVGG